MRQNTLRRFGLAAATVAAMAGPAAACTFDVPFANGSSQLGGQVQTFLDGFIAQNKGISVTVTGYASPEGASAANLALSKARAERVAGYLGQGGISSTTRAVGETVEPGRVARVSTRRCKLPSGEVLAGGGGAAGGAAALGALTPAAAAGAVVGALALGAALSAGGDSNSSGSTPATGSTGTTGTGSN